MDWFTILEITAIVISVLAGLKASYHFGRESAFRKKSNAAIEAKQVLQDLHLTLQRQNAVILAQHTAINELKADYDELKAKKGTENATKSDRRYT